MTNKLAKIQNLRNGDMITSFDTIFDQMFNDMFPNLKNEIGITPFNSTSYPKCDVVEYDDRFEVVADIPGLTKDQVTIELNDDMLTIKGDKSNRSTIKEGGTPIRRELKFSSFSRSFSINSNLINSNDVKAKFDDGLLIITLPRKQLSTDSSKVIEIEN